MGQHVHWPFHPQVSLNAWFWSTVFHTRDTDLTEVRAPISLSCMRLSPRARGRGAVAEQGSGVQLPSAGHSNNTLELPSLAR